MSITNDKEDRSKLLVEFSNKFQIHTKFDTEEDADRAKLLINSVLEELDNDK